jgi:hypothetical protein
MHNKVRTASNPDTRFIILIAKHILLNLVASCTEEFPPSQTPDMLETACYTV